MSSEWEHDEEVEANGISEDEFDFDELDGTEDPQLKREDGYEQRFRAASKAIKRKRSFKGEDDVDEFLTEYGDVAPKSSTKESGNLLHVLVEVVKHTEEIESHDVELLVRRLVRKYPDLLLYGNKDGYNPLYMAIRASNFQLVEYMVSTCEECAQEKETAPVASIHMSCLDDALRKQAQEGKTSLHVALEENLNANTIKMLIKNASDEALAIQDNLGKTPMHYAVQFAQCTDVRAEIIDTFIQRDLNALHSSPRPPKLFLDMVDKSGRSVYREHQSTRASTKKKFDAWAAKKASESRTANKTSEQNRGSKDDEELASRDPKEAARMQANSRDVSHSAALKSEVDRLAGRPTREKEGTSKVDERERLRQKKKEEEAERERSRQETGRPRDETLDRERLRQRKKEEEFARAREEVAEQNRLLKLAEANRRAQSDNHPDQLGVQTGHQRGPTEPSPNTPIKRTGTSRFDKPVQDKPPLRPQQTSRKSNTGERGNMGVWKKNSDEILAKLKLHYMRTRDVEMAIIFLYGTNMDDIQISFDYDRIPREIKWKVFENRFGANSATGLKFDEVLQYVNFPQVNVQLTGRQADMERDSEQRQGARQFGASGRKDMQHFFNWLYQKGVRHIIRVSVNDSGPKVHSDKAIQTSLERFVVEQLDWQKTDLDPQTILHVSSKVPKKPTNGDQKNIELLPNRQLKELVLRWSGSNAVLRAWSEPEGLPLLPQLKSIRLYMPQPAETYDDEQWITQKVKEFQARVNKNLNTGTTRSLTFRSEDNSEPTKDTRQIKVKPEYANIDEERKLTMDDMPLLISSLPAKGVNSHRWLDSTSRFAGLMSRFWKDTLDEFTSSRKLGAQGTIEKAEEDVVVALIDDGVDVFDSAFSGQVLEGKSFDFHNGKVRPPFSSAKNHGTVMASMILRVCPMAKIYPIRLKTYEVGGKNQIVMKYAAQAIQAALDKKATIISMSWTIPMPEGKSKEKDEMSKVLQKAVDRNVLMFCSSPDRGKFTDLDYPSGFQRDKFFRIGAARNDGTVFNWTPEDGISFVLPGVDVVKNQLGSGTSSREVTKRITDFEYETGSSVAAALASGLAAMIIYCVKVSVLALKTANANKGHILGMGISSNDATRITEYEAMKFAFTQLGEMTTNNFIPVWERLDPVSKMLEDAQARRMGQEETIEQFSRFASSLIKRDRVEPGPTGGR
ncbi:uncharacterized protein F4822DRAFT_279022 [Hypoxylon trugodes]|uniref:uncharacterized protein n=1 Tax=Hypoxylon trugodes TaxID=326681 RepID=UPI00218CBB0B|nr:uncharacterized protein F4822DRAFT_279022 [Hypoxylon trugodes]KAI1387302.1 hypothetical protein F4822DRAFT_279022 [Hypoxylon trugodes]